MSITVLPSTRNDAAFNVVLMLIPQNASDFTLSPLLRDYLQSLYPSPHCYEAHSAFLGISRTFFRRLHRSGSFVAALAIVHDDNPLSAIVFIDIELYISKWSEFLSRRCLGIYPNF